MGCFEAFIAVCFTAQFAHICEARFGSMGVVYKILL